MSAMVAGVTVLVVLSVVYRIHGYWCNPWSGVFEGWLLVLLADFEAPTGCQLYCNPTTLLSLPMHFFSFGFGLVVPLT